MRIFINMIIVFLLSVALPACANASMTTDTASSQKTKVSHNTAQKAVLITGASSGIGKQMALHLARNGYFVYAGARKPKDIKALSSIPNVQGVRLDVTIQADIDAAVAKVKQEGRGLYGLVNNAGVFLFDPLIEISEKNMQFIMDVNVFGPYRVTKAFAPMIIKNQGRIMTTGSVAGFVSNPLFGPYSMTKHAMEAYTDALDGEMRKFDVEVGIIEPGNFRSNIMKNMQRRIEQLDTDRSDSQYKDEIRGFASFAKEDRSMHMEAKPVAEALLHFLSSENPKRRYLVTPNAAEAQFSVYESLKRVVEINHGHAYEQNSDELSSVIEKLLTDINE